MVRVLAVLDSMWGRPRRSAPRWFPINPNNHSGRRLYKLTGTRYPELLVANACPGIQAAATRHGTPSADWLAQCLSSLPDRYQSLPLLICGKVAQRTFAAVRSYKHPGPVVLLAHPASRSWTRRDLDVARRKLAKLVR